MALTECSASWHTLPSCCLVCESGIRHAATHLLTTSWGEEAGWLPLWSSKATLRVVAQAKALLEPCIPPTACKAAPHLS